MAPQAATGTGSEGAAGEGDGIEEGRTVSLDDEQINSDRGLPTVFDAKIEYD